MADYLMSQMDVAIESLKHRDIKMLELIGTERLGKFIDELKSIQLKIVYNVRAETRDERYERLIYDGARDLAVKHGRHRIDMRNELIEMGVRDFRLLDAVMEAQKSPYYKLSLYRGKECDEGVIEALKDCLCPLHGF